MKISIVGVGNVGGLTALHLCSLGFKEITLVDIIPNAARAKAFDLSDAKFILKQDCRINGSDDINQIVGSEIIVITAGLTRKPGMKREELIQKNTQIIKGICQHIKKLCQQAIVIVVTNPLDAMTYLAIKETDLPARHVLGMGLGLDCSRLANAIAECLNVAVTEIEPCVIGCHGERMLPLSRYTKVKGKSLDTCLDQERIKELFQKTIKRGAEIVSLLGNGSAYFAPSAAIAELVRAIAKDQKRILPVSAYLDGEYGLHDICIGVPARLGRNGAEEIIELQLNDDERSAFLKSAESIKEQIFATGMKEYV